MKTHQQSNRGKTQTWLTPQWILNPLGKFDLDPCAAPSPRPWPTAISHIELPADGLAADWFGRVWLNPPFGKGEREKWMEKMANYGDGIMLIPAATETAAFREFVWNRASAILFLDRRPHFCWPDGKEADANSGCSICLVAYGEENQLILRRCPLGFTVTEWREPARYEGLNIYHRKGVAA